MRLVVADRHALAHELFKSAADVASSSWSQMLVTHNDGSQTMFRSVKSIDDCRRLAGLKLDSVEFEGELPPSDCVIWLSSRVR